MSKSPRIHTAEFKARVALSACKGDRTLSEIAAQHQVHVKLVQGWKKQMLEGAATVFSKTDKPVSSKESEAKQAEPIGIGVSVDVVGRCFDNIFVERLWRSTKYEELYPKRHVTELEAGLTAYFAFTKGVRPHQS